MLSEQGCPLCQSAACQFYHKDKNREYLQCQVCQLVFVPASYHLPDAEEKAQYDLHQNEIYDPAYRKFLSRLFDPMMEKLSPGMSGLDFGCGPGPALAEMFREAGMQMALYDKFYACDDSVLKQAYDFISATEVVEHLRHPAEVLENLWQQLKPDGILGVMTKMVKDPQAFVNWHYKNDPTHIVFFSRASWLWWGEVFGAGVEFVGEDVVILQKRPDPGK